MHANNQFMYIIVFTYYVHVGVWRSVVYSLFLYITYRYLIGSTYAMFLTLLQPVPINLKKEVWYTRGLLSVTLGHKSYQISFRMLSILLVSVFFFHVHIYMYVVHVVFWLLLSILHVHVHVNWFIDSLSFGFSWAEFSLPYTFALLDHLLAPVLLLSAVHVHFTPKVYIYKILDKDNHAFIMYMYVYVGICVLPLDFRDYWFCCPD